MVYFGSDKRGLQWGKKIEGEYLQNPNRKILLRITASNGRKFTYNLSGLLHPDPYRTKPFPEQLLFEIED